jgi:hypothetical protein
VCSGGDGVNGVDGTNGADGATGPAGADGIDGATGAAGADAASSLIRITAEPVGAQCAAGGQRIEVGLDDGAGGGTAKNGVLESGEVTQTAYVCNPEAITPFSIMALTTNNCAAVAHEPTTGDDRGGIAISSSALFYSGDTATGSFSLTDLTGASSVGGPFDALVSDIASGAIYSLAAGSDVPFSLNNCQPGTAFDRILKLDPATLAVTGSQMLSAPLSDPLPCDSAGVAGLYAGAGYMLIAGATDVYRVTYNNGLVRNIGPRPASLNPFPCENWAHWGVAEYANGEFAMAYRTMSGNDIVRTTMGNVTTVIQSFSNLSDLCSFSVSPNKQRWYFHHEGISQFATGDESIGYCDATLAL